MRNALTGSKTAPKPFLNASLLDYLNRLGTATPLLVHFLYRSYFPDAKFLTHSSVIPKVSYELLEQFF